MEVQGRIKLIGETQTFGSNGFRKREVVVTTEEQYPQHIMIEFVQDKTDLLNNYQVGQQVKVNINLRGREWVNPQGETKYLILFKDGELRVYNQSNQVAMYHQYLQWMLLSLPKV
jgi:uncharacterized protein Veg